MASQDKLGSGPHIGIVMDPIQSIKPHKDSTLALMLAAQDLGATLYYMEPGDLFVKDGQTFACMRGVSVFDNADKWFEFGGQITQSLSQLDSVLMRADPPVSKRFIHTCYMLERAAQSGVKIYNNPSALIEKNEKLFALDFPEFCPPSIVASDYEVLRGFLNEHEKIVIKPLDSMGGEGVFMVSKGDVNFDVIWEVQTARGAYPVIAQAFIKEISAGDRRVLVIDGKPFPYVLVRTPKEGSMRGNMAAGGSTHVRAIDNTEKAIAEKVGPVLKEMGIVFAGLDVIGNSLIEINITSPTGLRQIAKESGMDPAGEIMRAILHR